MILLIGLGNPGPEYSLTRHNAGFMVVDVLAHHFSFPSFKRRGEALFTEGEIKGHKATLFKPMSFMNRSGIPVSDFVRFFKIPLEDIMVVHDDLDLALGHLKIKQGGGAAGHNGLRSLDAHIGSHYWRLRIGIDRPSHKDGVQAYVLKNFSSKEQEVLDPLLDAVVAEAPLLACKDRAAFLNNVALRRQQ